DRQVDSTGRDHHGHAQGHQDQRCSDAEDVDQAAVQVSVADLDFEEPGCDEEIAEQQEDQHENRPEQPVPQHHPAVHWATPPTIAAMTCSTSTPSWLAISVTIRRSRSTAILWLSRSTSSSSAEMNTTAIPPSESDQTSFWISAFAPTSIPRV